MEKVGEITEEGTLEEIKNHLTAIYDQMQQITAAIRASGRKDDLPIFLHNATEMAAAQVYRITLWLNEPNDLIAWAARNILELDLLLRYALQSEDNMKRLFADYLVDSIDIEKKFMELSEGNPAHQERYERRIEAYKEDAKSRGLTLEKQPISTSLIAPMVGLETEYRALNKVNSKYVHPTSWRLIGRMDVTDTIDIKNVFLAQSQLHGIHILQQASQVTGIPHNIPWRIVILPDP